MRFHSALASILIASTPLSCGRCDARSDARRAPDGGSAPEAIRLLPPPRAWTFARVRLDAGIALPEGCRERAPLSRAEVPGLTRFVAEPRTLGALIVADGTGATPPALSGVAALTLDPEGATRDPVPLPWLDPTALPRLARAGSRWIGALERPGSASSRVLLWRGEGAEPMGEGDGFEAIDLACEQAPGAARAGCALLTNRALEVAAPGATAWLGSPDDPAAKWRAIEILPASAESDARPLGIAAYDGSRAEITMIERGEVVFHEVSAAGGARERGRVAAPHGAIDAISLARRAILAFASPSDEEGCAREGRPGVRLARAGESPADFPLPAAPLHGSLRRLARGALATWIAPVGCRVPRKVVYAMLIDEQGAPVGSPTPVADAAAFAVSARGEEVDLWLQEAGVVSWVRARCAPPGG